MQQQHSKAIVEKDRAFHVPRETHDLYSSNALKSSVGSGKLTADDAALIREFIQEIKSTRRVSSSRAYKINSHMITWRDFIGPFREAKVSDIYQAIENLNNAKKTDGKPYAQNTKRDFIPFLKRFYLWMIENGYSDVPEKKIRAIQPPGHNTMTKTAEQLLTEDEIRAMINNCQNSRDRALVSVLYEGGFRIGELGKLTWDQVKFTEWNAAINVNDKTGKPRFIPLVMSRSFLARWRNDYPLEPSGKNPVFVVLGAGGHYRKTEQGRRIYYPLQYRGVAKQLRAIAKRAGVNRRITPHLFRHSRITHLIQKGYKESIIKMMCWGNINTNMFSTYAHLTNADTEREVAEKEGVIQPDKKTKSKVLEPKQCKRCYYVNGPTARFCDGCGLELDVEVVDEMRQATTQAELLPEYKELLKQVQALQQQVMILTSGGLNGH